MYFLLLYLQLCVHNSKDYQKEKLNYIKRFFRLEQYRKVYFYDIGNPNLDSEVFGYMSNNLSEEAFAYLVFENNFEFIRIIYKLYIYRYTYFFIEMAKIW